MERISTGVRAGLLSLASNVGLFVFVAFLTDGILSSSLLVWYQTEIGLFREYVVVPWGMALCLLRLERRSRAQLSQPRWDIHVLFALLAWIIVPFAIRFGLTFNNINSWQSYAVAYFGIYALLSESTQKERERCFDTLLLVVGAASLALGSALLYCAANGLRLTVDDGAIPFGMFWDAYGSSWHLGHGVNYNITGMVCVCMALLCMAGISRSRNVILRALFVCASALMVLVVVLTQSRTSRYALLAALAVGAYGVVAGRSRMGRAAARHAAALVVAAVVLVGGYVGADAITRAALAHYSVVMAVEEQPQAESIPSPEASQTDDELTKTPETAVVSKPRAAVDRTFSARTDIWMNLIKLWREDPKYLLIGNGVGRTGSRIVQGTIHESIGAVAVHNTYLQYAADFGLIGAGLLAAFLALMVAPACRVFFARGVQRQPGYTALCMIVVACLLTGMMESAPLGAMTPMNMVLFFALALLAGRGHELGALVKQTSDMV